MKKSQTNEQNRLPLSDRESAVLGILIAVIEQTKGVPTRAEIAEALALPEKTGRAAVQVALKGLQRKGRIKIKPGWRNILIINKK